MFVRSIHHYTPIELAFSAVCHLSMRGDHGDNSRDEDGEGPGAETDGHTKYVGEVASTSRFSLGWCCHTSALLKTSLHELGVQFRLEVIGRAKGCEKLIDASRIARKDL
jgi:hypothetical protein